MEASAKTVLKTLRLPPAILRKEPLLLTVSPDRLVSGFSAETKKVENESTDVKTDAAASVVREACKDMPSLLLETCTK